jgi:subtilase family serine protease
VAAAADSYLCSQYWGQHAERIPAAYGRTSAPTQLCGYTPGQLRTAYGVSSSRYTGKGVTIAIVMTDSSPTMLSDANRFFTSHGVAGFAPGQFTVNAPAPVAATCSSSQLSQDQPGGFDVNALEEAIDVESVHITAPAANVVYVVADCDEDSFGGMQDLLDAATRVVDQHLASLVSGSFSDDESLYSPADGAAWNLTFEQGAIEGIGFDLSSGDGGADITPPVQTTASVTFPSSSPWVTAVGGTTLEIGRNGAPVADYPWGDNVTQVNTDGTGYTGAVTSGVYGQTLEGGTSEATPLFAGLEADAIQSAGHPMGFLNPALYLLHGSAAIRDVPPVSPADPPAVIVAQPGLGDGNDYLTTLGEDQSPLRATRGYDDETGLGAPGPSFVTAFTRFKA